VQSVAAASARKSPAAAATTAVLLAVAALSGSAGAAAAPGDSCRSDIPLVRHVVLFEPGTAVDAARAEVSAACGSVSGYYPEIAVAVATSADSAFADHIGRDRAYSAQAEALTGAERPAGTPRASRPPRAVGVQSTGVAAVEVGTADRTDEQWNLTMIGADRANSRQLAGSSVLVGILDSGVDVDHPELAAAVDRSASAGCVSGVPDQSPKAWRASGQHGTHVAGIIAAADDGAGITGVAPGVRIASVKVVDSGGFIYPEYAVCGFVWAARNKMRITNHSYFVDPWLLTCRNEPGQSVVYEAVSRAARYAAEQGVLAVAAAGNDGLDLAAATVDTQSPNNARRPRPRPVDERCDVLPAELPDVLAVSAVGAAGVKSSYSSYGAGVVDLTAPGGDARQRSPMANSGCVLSTVPGGYGRMCGTSMAAPHVAGVAALVASANPDAGPAELARLVQSSATPLPCPADGYDPDSDGTPDASCAQSSAGNGFYGAGLVNAVNALS